MLEDTGDDWERFDLRADEFIPIGSDRLLVIGQVRARGRASGVEVDYGAAWLCYLRDGKVIRVRFYSDREEALAAAGG
jgi:ketosteroid isomerase-like protein